MTNYFRRLLMTLIVSLLGVLALATPAHASDLLQKRPANLTIEPLNPLMTGDHPTLVVHLTTDLDKPIPNQPIIIKVDGKRKVQGKTDSRGVAEIILKYKFSAGTYHIQAIYPGITAIGINSAMAEMDMVIKPARFAIYTVPPTPGVVFKLNGQSYRSDQDGVVHVEVKTSGNYALEVLPIDQDKLPSNVRMEFARWNDNVFTPKREVHLPRNRRIEVGFTVNYQVNQVFYDSEGALVDPARIASLTIRGAGATFKFDKAGPIWLPANRLTRRIGERLQSEEILYYFRGIIIDGANVINKSEQRFRIRPDDVWPVQVLLYSAHFSARDAMFHFPTGKGIELTYPDGHKQEFLFDSPNAEIVIPSLARGSYSARIIGAGGSAPPTPTHLSRDQDIELLIFSYLDMGVLFSTGALIALALLLLGRPYIIAQVRGLVVRKAPTGSIQPVARSN